MKLNKTFPVLLYRDKYLLKEDLRADYNCVEYLTFQQFHFYNAQTGCVIKSTYYTHIPVNRHGNCFYIIAIQC